VSSNPSWFPTPPPKPLKAPSAAKLVFGTIAPAVAVVGAIVWMSSGHSGHKATAASAPAAVAVTAAAQDRREAFRECMRSLGGGSSKSLRNAFEVCHSLLRSAPATPVAPSATRRTSAPIA
jgi:hypothetical protein